MTAHSAVLQAVLSIAWKPLATSTFMWPLIKDTLLHIAVQRSRQLKWQSVQCWHFSVGCLHSLAVHSGQSCTIASHLWIVVWTFAQALSRTWCRPCALMQLALRLASMAKQQVSRWLLLKNVHTVCSESLNHMICIYFCSYHVPAVFSSFTITASIHGRLTSVPSVVAPHI